MMSSASRRVAVGRQGDRVGDHAGFGALDLVDLAGLGFGRQVAVDDANPALARQGNRQAGLGDRVHGRREEGDVQPDVARQAGAHVGLRRQDFGITRDDQQIVKGQRLGWRTVLRS